MVRIALLGCGRIGRVHARTLQKARKATLVTVSDAVSEAAETLAQSTGAEALPPEAAIERADVDAVLIATPTDTHYDLIHAAAAAGKAIFCEKPIDLSAERIRACLEAVARAGVPFMTAFNRRFDPNFAELQTRLRAGVVGAPELVTILSRDPSPPPIEYIERSGGIFRDMMIHDFDMARFLLGEEPVEVFATGSCLIDDAIAAAGDFDTAAVTLKTASGKICQISNSRRARYGYDQRVEVHCSEGLLRVENLRENSVETAGAAGFHTAPTKHFFLERYAQAYTDELMHFVDAVSSGTTPSPSGDDGLKAQLLADAAALSAAEGRPILLQEVDASP